jgi:putative DNA primase/helicase
MPVQFLMVKVPDATPEKWGATEFIAQPAFQPGSFFAETRSLPEKAYPEIWASMQIQPAKAPDAKVPNFHLDPNFIPQTDGAIARAVLKKFPGIIKYCPQQRSFIVWNEKRGLWEFEPMRAYGAIKSLLEDLKTLFSSKLDKEQSEAAIKLQNILNTSSRIEGVVAYLRSEPEALVEIDHFDKNKMLFNCENVTIDCASGLRREHSQADFITMRANVSEVPAAQCPIFINFLFEIFFGNAEIVRFVQRWCGYCLTGSVAERIMLIWLGATTTGKSTLLRVLHSIFGDYSIRMRAETLLHKDFDRVNNDIASLRGKRFAWLSESARDGHLDESLIKDLNSGGDPITARFLFKEFFTFTPQTKLSWATNFPPKGNASDNALWTRLFVVPFKFTPTNIDKHLDEKLLSEKSGILNWMIEGLSEWRRIGLQPPEAILQATKEVRGEMDTIGHFIEECCDVDRSFDVSADELYSSYEAWAKRNGHRPLSKNSLGRELTLKSFDADKKCGVRVRLGLRLKPIEGKNEF